MSDPSDRARFDRDHHWAPDRMSDYLDRELAASGRARMERHLAECEACRRLLAGLRAVVDRLHQLPAPTGGADAVEVASSVRVRLSEPPAR